MSNQKRSISAGRKKDYKMKEYPSVIIINQCHCEHSPSCDGRVKQSIDCHAPCQLRQSGYDG